MAGKLAAIRNFFKPPPPVELKKFTPVDFYSWWVFVSDHNNMHGVQQKQRSNLHPKDVLITCYMCDEPAKYLDCHFPYHAEYNRCETHKV